MVGVFYRGGCRFYIFVYRAFYLDKKVIWSRKLPHLRGVAILVTNYTQITHIVTLVTGTVVQDVERGVGGSSFKQRAEYMYSDRRKHTGGSVPTRY